MLTYDNFSKKCQVIFKYCSYFFWDFLSYLICNFTPAPCKEWQDKNMSVRIGLIEFAKASDTLNYRTFFKHCILKALLHVFLLLIFLWNKFFCPKNWAIFYICFDSVWVGIWKYENAIPDILENTIMH